VKGTWIEGWEVTAKGERTKVHPKNTLHMALVTIITTHLEKSVSSKGHCLSRLQDRVLA
jgi:hypothetical protein